MTMLLVPKILAAGAGPAGPGQNGPEKNVELKQQKFTNEWKEESQKTVLLWFSILHHRTCNLTSHWCADGSCSWSTVWVEGDPVVWATGGELKSDLWFEFNFDILQKINSVEFKIKIKIKIRIKICLFQALKCPVMHGLTFPAATVITQRHLALLG